MDQNERIFRVIEAMPSLPRTVEELMVMTCSHDCTSSELMEVLGRDPMFSLKLLRLVNSSFCGMDEEAASLQRAAVFVGTNYLWNLAIGIGVVGAVPGRNLSGLDSGEFWLHSLAVGVAARMLAERLGASSEDAMEYFLAGVLHDIGKLVHSMATGPEFSRAVQLASEPGCSLSDAEIETLGIAHSTTGYELARKWNLPASVAAAIRYHHVPAASSGDPMVCCVHAANEVAKKLAFGSAGNFEVQSFAPAVEKYVGGTVEELVGVLVDLDLQVEDARIFIKLAEAGA